MSSIFFPFPLPLTGRQWFYIGFLQGIGAGIIDGGINFAIAYAMYQGQDEVTLWVFNKSTIAGDLGVTCLIQVAVSMLISSTLVHSDIHHSAIKPLPFVYPHVTHLPDPALLWRRSSEESTNGSPPSSSDSSEKPQQGATNKSKKGFKYYWRMLLRFTFEGTERNIILEACGARDWFGRLGWTILQGLSLSIFFGLPLWILAIIILGPIYKGGNLGNKWAPQVIKLVFAFLLGIITNPIIALMALGSQAQHHLIPLTTPPSTSTLVPPSSPTLSHRPPLVANVSMIAPLGSPSTLLPPPPPPGMGRPRALTNASSTGSIYSLGGSGGRAQRPRAGSRSSGTGPSSAGDGLAPPSFNRERSGSYGGSRVRDRSGSGSVVGGSDTGTGRTRAGSVGGERKTIPSSWTGGGGEGTGLAGARLRETEELEVPRESLEGRPSVAVGEEREVGEMTGEEVERELREKEEKNDVV